MKSTRFLQLIPPLLLFILWEVVALGWPSLTDAVRRNNPSLVAKMPDLMFISDPISTTKALIDLCISGDLLLNATRTIIRTLISFSCASILGVALGWLLASRSAFEKSVMPSVEAIRSLPPVALLPVFVLVAGIGETFSVSFSTFGTMWPVTIATYAALKGVDRVSIQTGQNLGLTNWQMTRYILGPLSAPGLLTGLRIALPLGLILVVVAEIFVGGGTGLGAQLDYAKRSFRFDEMMAIIFSIGGIGYLLNVIFAWVERKIVWWEPKFWETREQ